MPSWSTAHGDLHVANLCAPTLHILDWEGWGLAPTGYDAATLHSRSLLVPTVASQIRDEVRHILDNPADRFAELAFTTEGLHRATQGDNPTWPNRCATAQPSSWDARVPPTKRLFGVNR